MVTFIGAGPGAADLITLRGAAALQKADIVIYAGSLVNPELLELCPKQCRIHNSATMTLDEVMDVPDRILVMYEGEIVGEFDPKKITVQELGLYMAGARRQGKEENA